VDAILGESHTPEVLRTELAEELYGHLVERWADLVAGGMDEAEAADQAIASFGRPERLGRELTGSFHGRLWASTIGVLVPGYVPADRWRPGLILWVQLGIAFEAFSALLGVAASFFLPPLLALLVGPLALASFLVLVAAFVAVGRGRWWAVPVAVVAFLADTYRWIVAQLDAHGLFISISGVLAVALIIAIWSTRLDQAAYFTRGQRPGRIVTVGLAAVLAAASAVPVLGASLRDPTMVVPADLDLRLAVACETSTTQPAIRTARVTVTVTWARHDVLLNGLVGTWIGGQRDNDALLVDASGPPPPDSEIREFWNLDDWPGEQPWLDPFPSWPLGDGGGTSLEGPAPSIDPSDPSQAGSFAPRFNTGPLGIRPDLLTTGQPYTIAYSFTNDQATSWPVIRTRYVHEYRFAEEATATCGQTGVGHPAP
jgi:hypothetical protein